MPPTSPTTATKLNKQIDAVIRAKDKYVTDEVAVNQATLDRQIAADAGR